MSVDLRAQTEVLLWAMGTGLGLGMFYDLLRALRREVHRAALPADLLFALGYLLALLLTVVYARGIRGYQLLGIILGAGLWFGTLSPGFTALIRRGIRHLRRGFRFLAAGCKKFMIFCEKI